MNYKLETHHIIITTIIFIFASMYLFKLLGWSNLCISNTTTILANLATCLMCVSFFSFTKQKKIEAEIQARKDIMPYVNALHNTIANYWSTDCIEQIQQNLQKLKNIHDSHAKLLSDEFSSDSKELFKCANKYSKSLNEVKQFEADIAFLKSCNNNFVLYKSQEKEYEYLFKKLQSDCDNLINQCTEFLEKNNCIIPVSPSKIADSISPSKIFYN